LRMSHSANLSCDQIRLYDFLALAKQHYEELSGLCNLCSLLSHELSKSVKYGNSSFASSMPLHLNQNCINMDDRFDPYSNILPPCSKAWKAMRDGAINYGKSMRKLSSLYENLVRMCDDIRSESVDSKEDYSCVAKHSSLCERVCKSCFPSTFEENIFLIIDDAGMYDRQLVALSSTQASLARLELLLSR